jgi:fucose 4-O-acetylase-like acetyltransferase
MCERIPWVDIAKGIGIVFVVIGHNLTHYKIYEINKYIYWFHMPLFFIISGLLHKQDAGQRAFIKSRFMHLMIPYGAFLFLFLLAGAKSYNSRQTINLLLGGAYDAGIWWFVTCLFFTQITAYYILKIKKARMVLYAACILYYIAMITALAYTDFYYNNYPVVELKLPLGIEIVPMATVFYLIGFFLKPLLLPTRYCKNYAMVVLLLVLCFIICLDYYAHVVIFPEYSMYSKDYAYPVVNLIIPVAFFFVIRYFSILISTKHFASAVFTQLGRASLIIMFLHMFLPDIFFQCLNKIFRWNLEMLSTRILLGILLPFCVYCTLEKYQLTRKIFLGL